MSLSTLPAEPVTETLHGVTITDRFRWLEDRNSDATSAWIADQRLRLDAYFGGVADLEALRARVDAYLNVEVIEQPVRVGEKLFYRKRKKDQEQACICVQDMNGNEERVLVDPSPRGRFVSVAIHHVSDEGSLLAFELKHGGSDATQIYFVITASGQILPDHLPIGYARGLVFAPDLGGFFYCHEDLSRTEDHTVRFHKFGSGSDDPVLFRRGRTARSRLALTADGVRLGAICRREDGVELRTDLYLANLNRGSDWRTVFRDKLFPYEPLLYRGRIFVFSEENAPNGRVVELSNDGTEIRVVVPESRSRIEQFTWVGEAIYARYLVERKNAVCGWRVDGSRVESVALPTEGTIQLLPRLIGSRTSLFYTYESFDAPLGVYEYQPRVGESTLLAKRGASVDTRTYRVDEQGYASYDGMRIPIFLVMRSDLDPTAPHPVVMTSYGGFGVSMTPRFSVLATVLVELGAVFALPCIRGGSEFGKAWHEAARRRKRQVAISDFIAAAEWVSIWHGSSPRQIGIFGGSNSGLLVAAAVTQRPDLFRAVLCIAPLLDMVRHELFDNGRKWRQEYGTVDDPEDFAALYRYSPYHHVAAEVNYPATLFVAGDQDDRCNPAHVRKMAARLQERPPQRQPILVDYSAERGHSPILPLSIRTEALVRRIAFFCRELKIPLPAEGLR
jgi:prolyl oligopeptidase